MFLWLNDSNQFLINEEDEENIVGIRKGCLTLINSLIEYFPKEAQESLLIIVEKFLNNLDEDVAVPYLETVFSKVASAPNPNAKAYQFDRDSLLDLVKTSCFNVNTDDHRWKKREVGLSLMGAFAEDIITFYAKKNENFDMKKVIENLVKDLNPDEAANTIPVLKGRAIWCVFKFSDIIVKRQTDLCIPLIRLFLGTISTSEPFPVRMAACRSIASFAMKINQAGLLNGENGDLLREEGLITRTENIDELLDIMKQCVEDTVHYPLDALRHLGELHYGHHEKIAAVASEQLMELYAKYATDKIIGDSLKELFTLLCKTPASFQIIHEKFSGIVLKIFTDIQAAFEDQSLHALLQTLQHGSEGENARTYTDYVTVSFSMTAV
jgi:hypothetical protein